LVLTESNGPRSYHLSKTVTYTTKSGQVLEGETVKARVKSGAPVHVYYVGDSDNMFIERVVLDEE
jgi:hypothetical protein